MKFSTVFGILAGIIPAGFPIMIILAFFGLITVTEAAEVFTWYIVNSGYWFSIMVIGGMVSMYLDSKGE